MTLYVYNNVEWPEFRWDSAALAQQLGAVRKRQGQLLGWMKNLGYDLQQEAELETITEEIEKSSEIEGESLDREQIRSSVARRLGMDVGALTQAERNVEGIVDMMIDATTKFDEALTSERLFGWHAALFPTGYKRLQPIRIGAWRDDRDGPMQVISGPMGKHLVHFEAPAASRLDEEMKQFLVWYNGELEIDSVLKAALAHLWFVTIHPFDDGNGRIARAIADMTLARSDGTSQRFYSMSPQICADRKGYYNILEETQKGTLDVTAWMHWFLGCLDRAFDGANDVLASVLKKASFWRLHVQEQFNDRQKSMLDKLLNGFTGKLTRQKWVKITKCSAITAYRDISYLIERRILVQEPAGGRSTSYLLNTDFEKESRTHWSAE